MGRQSAINKLDPRVRETVDRLVRAGRTIDEIVDQLEQLDVDETPSRSSVGRYVKRAREQMAHYRQAQELAKVWVGKLEEDPDSDVGRLLSEMLRTVAFQQLSQMGEAGESGEAPQTKDIAYLAGAIKDMASADKLSAEREIRIRQETAKQAADKAEQIAKKGGMAQATVREIRQEILGVAK